VWLRDELLAGQVLTLFVITIAAAEVGLGLAIVLLVFRNRATSRLDELDELADEPAPESPQLQGRRETVGEAAQTGHPAERVS
jgi:NADH-quinone oxidoreductase subunit K